jgi:hypothetical protein
MVDDAEKDYENRNFTAEDAKAAEYADNHRKNSSSIAIQIDNEKTIENMRNALQSLCDQKKLSESGGNFLLTTFRTITDADMKLTQLSRDESWLLFKQASMSICAELCDKFEVYGLYEETDDNMKSKTIDTTAINFIMQSIVNPKLKAIFNRNIGQYNTTFGTLNKQIFQKVTEVVGDKKPRADFGNLNMGMKI